MTQTMIDDHAWPDAEPATFDLSGIPRTAYIPLLTAIYAIGVSLFVAVEPTKPWILLIVVALVGLGADGIMRTNPRASLDRWSDTAPFLFVPVLFALASGLFLEEVVAGYRTVPSVIVASLLLSAGLYGEYVTTITHGPSYALGRLLLNVLTYLSAFAFFAVVYEFNVGLVSASFAVGLFSMLLSVEILREAEADAFRALGFAAAIGSVLAEMRWALYFIPLDGFLAATLLLMIFYQASGVVQHYLTRDLSRTVLFEFSTVTVAGLAIVIVGRLFGLD
jgi:hypothetical protein